MSTTLHRVRSIDAFRAVTMFLMIFVNDIDGMPNTPQWIQHAKESADALGLADTIFPAFLFIVGLSIPFAFQNRLRQGNYRIPWRIVTRSAAMIFIGVFFTNVETYNEEAALLPRPVWESMGTLSIFLIFLDYDHTKAAWRRYTLRGLGILLLIVLSWSYKSTDPAHPWLHFTWWGILGLIGWAYLVCALIYYYSGGQLWIQAAAWLFFMFFNIDFHFGWFEFLTPLQNYVWIAGNGAMQAFTMAGVFVAVLYMRLAERNELKLLWIGMLLMSVILFNLGFIVRFVSGGISKIRDTPAWVLICTAISLVVYALFIFIVDFKKKYHWFKPIEPAGVATFTAYIVPGLFYPIYEMMDIEYPDLLSQGTGGIIKCILFALAMIGFTGLLQRINIRLKI
ncbi:heparan-alpha-glucosaminide N-acetyltransferase domain-containing protein [Mucilaginibacter calamicampi]|uniref:Heparan-alpha-glucosaminide N-acetyltransferase domain-containing protein n=1 Tax=Mucilaginibacter calamicampi TaxID=1302352 RepID=A0ABW2YZ77_9SPHI